MKRIVIVEDEAEIRDDLLAILKSYGDFVIAGTAGTVPAATDLIQKEKPDIVLLDIQLGAHTAFDLLNTFGYFPFHIIFITAYSQHAIKAIKYGALDYLLKPVDEQELAAALVKTSGPFRFGTSKESLQIAQAYWEHANASVRQIVLRTQQTMHIVQVSDIIYCKSDACYTTFYLNNEKPVMVSKPIKVYEELLPEEDFLRPHQSYLVNQAFIKGYHRDGYLVLSEGIHIPVSVRKRERVIDFLTR